MKKLTPPSFTLINLSLSPSPKYTTIIALQIFADDDEYPGGPYNAQ